MGIDHSFFSPRPVYIAHAAMVTPLGTGTRANMDRLTEGRSGIAWIDDKSLSLHPLPLAKVPNALLQQTDGTYKCHTRFDSLLMACIDDLLQDCPVDFSSPDTRVLLSTTKGNIELLETDETNQALWLSYSAKAIREKLGHPHEPIIVSNACISGVSACIVARRLLQRDVCRHVLVIGCDVLSRFVLEGFQSFHAISQQPCKPFDASRDGITLGEASAALVLSTAIRSDILLGDGAISNDANHISGPSRTGEELNFCIRETLRRSALHAGDIGFISAHGTATVYNDEMESKAFEMAGLQQVPLFSLKGAYGHTLGASGLVDLLVSAECLRQNLVLPSLGFDTPGVGGQVTVNRELLHANMHAALKTASGFGGCNAAIALYKDR